MSDFRFPGWPDGINNVSRKDQAPGTSLREARNVDLINEGKPRRRQGYRKVYDGAAMHSLFSLGRSLLAVENGELKQWANPEGTPTTVATGLIGLVSYVRINDYVVWSADNMDGMVYMDGATTEFGIQDVQAQPVVAVSPNGGMNSGHVMVAVTHQRDGLESGTGEASYIDVVQGQGIELTNIPQAPGITAVNIYASDPNGQTLYFRRSVAPGVTTAVVGNLPPQRQLITQFTQKMPPSSLAAIHNGTMFRAVGRTAFVSRPMHFWSYDSTEGYFVEASEINMLQAGEGGLFVGCAEGVYYYSGEDPQNFTRSWVSATAIDRAAIEIDGGYINDKYQGRTLVLWWTVEGVMIIGMPDGSAEIVRDMEFSTSAAESAVMAQIQRDGSKQIVSIMKNPAGDSALSFSDSVEITVHRNGVEI